MLSAVQAADEGQAGQTFPIIETDLLSSIAARLKDLEATGQIDALQQRFVRSAEESVRRPPAVAGIAATTTPREWLFDPSIVTQDPLTDAKGQVIAPAGTRINPLDFVQLREDLVFIDGNDAAQLSWATQRWSPQRAKIIFVAGSPFEAMKPFARRFYFDQGGKLVSRFGIAHVPAVVSASGKALRIAEVPLATRPS